MVACPQGGSFPPPGLASVTRAGPQNPLGCNVPVLVDASGIQGEFVGWRGVGIAALPALNNPAPRTPSLLRPHPPCKRRPTPKKHLQRVPAAQLHTNPPKPLPSPTLAPFWAQTKTLCRRGKERKDPLKSRGIYLGSAGVRPPAPHLGWSRGSSSPCLVPQAETPQHYLRNNLLLGWGQALHFARCDWPPLPAGS